MAARLPGDYFVWNTITRELVTEVRAEAPVSIHARYPVANESRVMRYRGRIEK